MKYEFFMGLRYLRSRRREGFISLITMISVLGVMIGVMTLIVVMAVMTGFEETLRDRLLGVNSHIAVIKPGDTVRGYRELTQRLAREEGVVGAAPIVYGQVMVTSGQRVSGVVVRGIDPDRVTRVVDVGQFIKEGNFQELKRLHKVEVDGQTLELPGLIIGSRLVGQLGANPGAAVQVISPMAAPSALGMIPKIRRFAVVGEFRTGMQEYDSTLIYMNLADAQKFFEMGDAVTAVELRVANVYRAQQIAERIQRELGFNYIAEDWSRLWPNLFSALRLEKTVYFLVLLLMIMIGAFNIISTLTMVVMEKRRDIAILQSMGAARRSIRKIFLIKGCVIGTVGTVAGIVLGYILCLLIERYEFIHLPEGVFLIPTVPVRMYLSNFVLIAVSSFVICLLASIYPARQAAKLDPVEIIRYE
jgi:lipoprotein-releasing system permease protein